MGVRRINNFVEFALLGAADRGKLCAHSAPGTPPVGRWGTPPFALDGILTEVPGRLANYTILGRKKGRSRLPRPQCTEMVGR